MVIHSPARCEQAQIAKSNRKNVSQVCSWQVVKIESEEDTKWLKPRSSAHIALEEVVTNKKLLKDISKLTEFHHTGNLEVYHFLLLKYAPKRQHFSYKGMIARTQLAVIDHNSNVKRQQAQVKRGENKGAKRYNVVFPKGKKFLFYFILFIFATRAGSPQQREPITVGPYYLTHPVNFPCGRKPEYPEKTHNFRQSVDYALFT